MNCIGFGAMWADKRKAIRHRWRISERTLLMTAALGGSIGVLAGMYIFRHKTKHLKFVIGVPAILAAQLILFLVIAGGHRQRMGSPSGVVRTQLEQIRQISGMSMPGFLFYQDESEAGIESENTQDAVAAASLFFRNFTYKLEDEQIDGDRAAVDVTITNLATHALARDLCLSLTKQNILFAGTSDDHPTADDYYTLLKDTLSSHEYPLKDTTATFHLTYEGKRWQLIQDQQLQDAVSSGFISALQDPDLVKPEEVLTMYMDQFAQMDTESWRSYLEMNDIFATGSTAWAEKLDTLYASLIAQYYDWSLDSCEADGQSAVAGITVTSIDMPHVLAYYKESLLDYAGTSDSITSPSEEQADASASFLYDCLQSYAQAGTVEVTLNLQNDGRVWQIVVSDELTNAFLGDIDKALSSLTEEP